MHNEQNRFELRSRLVLTSIDAGTPMQMLSTRARYIASATVDSYAVLVITIVGLLRLHCSGHIKGYMQLLLNRCTDHHVVDLIPSWLLDPRDWASA